MSSRRSAILNSKPSHVITRWESHEPAIRRQNSPDHWTKLKVKESGSTDALSQKQSFLRPNVMDSSRFTGTNLNHASSPMFQSTIIEKERIGRAATSVPSHGMYVPVRSAQRSAQLYDNTYSRQARDGYVYWYCERPKPTKYGRYHFGQYKTFLGLGSAPRS